jgi:hypothetical protein
LLLPGFRLNKSPQRFALVVHAFEGAEKLHKAFQPLLKNPVTIEWRRTGLTLEIFPTESEGAKGTNERNDVLSRLAADELKVGILLVSGDQVIRSINGQNTTHVAAD